MATESQIDLIGGIARIAAQISFQGKYHVMLRYSGHVDVIDVTVHPSSNNYTPSESVCIDGFEHNQNWILLGAESGELSGLYQKLSSLLDVDADGVPV